MLKVGLGEYIYVCLRCLKCTFGTQYPVKFVDSNGNFECVFWSIVWWYKRPYFDFGGYWYLRSPRWYLCFCVVFQRLVLGQLGELLGVINVSDTYFWCTLICSEGFSKKNKEVLVRGKKRFFCARLGWVWKKVGDQKLYRYFLLGLWVSVQFQVCLTSRVQFRLDSGGFGGILVFSRVYSLGSTFQLV